MTVLFAFIVPVLCDRRNRKWIYALTQLDEKMEERKLNKDIVALGLLAAIVFLIASVVTYSPSDPVHNPVAALDSIYQPDQLVYPQNEVVENACGALGAWFSGLLFNTLGIGTYFLIIGMIALEIALFRKQSVHAPWVRTTGWALSLMGVSVLCSLLVPACWVASVVGAGGHLGLIGKVVLQTHVGALGCFIVADNGYVCWRDDVDGVSRFSGRAFCVCPSHGRGHRNAPVWSSASIRKFGLMEMLHKPTPSLLRPTWKKIPSAIWMMKRSRFSRFDLPDETLLAMLQTNLRAIRKRLKKMSMSKETRRSQMNSK